MSINKNLNSNSNPPEKSFNVIISCSLSKDVTVYSNDYNCEELNNPFNAYVKHHYTILDLLNILSNIAKEKLNDNKKHLDYYVNKWKQILEDCKGWIVDEEIVEQQ